MTHAASHPIPAESHLALERLPAVSARVGLSRAEIYKRIARGQFPRPIQLAARVSVWSAGEVDDWIRTQLASREAVRQ